MKILHLCLSSFYIENFGYQENLIPKYNKLDGHDVTILASTFNYNERNGEAEWLEEKSYFNSHGIKVIRVDFKYPISKKINDKLKIYKDTYKILESEKPDIIFVHGIQFLDLKQVVKYKKKHPECKVVADNHAAYINSAQNFFSKHILHKLIYKKAIQESVPHIDKYFMIAPGCKSLAKQLYQLPEEKMEYLFLGADTANINLEHQKEISKTTRLKLNINEKDFVYITGGKLNRGKKTEELINSFKKIKGKDLKLIIFGVFSDDIKRDMLELIKTDERIKYIGWLQGEAVYDYFLASNVAIFPGTKSALWEQAICSGLPLICKRWPGMEYVDVGGNCIFLNKDNLKEIEESMNFVRKNIDKYETMKEIAETIGYETFSYEKIARQALDIN